MWFDKECHNHKVIKKEIEQKLTWDDSSIENCAKIVSWNELIFYPRKQAEINLDSSLGNDLKSADFLGKETSWN